MSKDWSNIKLAIFGDDTKIGTSIEQGNNSENNKTTYKVKAKGNVNFYFGNNSELMKEVDKISEEEFFENNAPVSLRSSIKENLIESYRQGKTPEESKKRIGIIEKIVKNPMFKKSHKEKLINLLNNSVKDEESWKEEIYGIIFNWYSENNNLQIELFDFLNEFDRMSKKEFYNLLKLLSWLKIVFWISNDNFSVIKWIMEDEERNPDLKDLWELFQDKKSGEHDYLILKIPFKSLNQKYSLFIPGSSYQDIDSIAPKNVSKIYSYPLTDRGLEWLKLLEMTLGDEINFFSKLFIDLGHLNLRS